MRKIFLLLSLVSVLGACQKKQYVTFNYQNSAAYIAQKSATTIQKDQERLVEPPTLEVLTAAANETSVFMTPAEIAAARIPAEAVSSPITPELAEAVASSALNKPVRLTIAQKIVARKIQKQIQKANAPEGKKAVKEKADTIALLSLIFGGAGLLLLFVGGGLGILLGIAGLVMGIIGLGRVKKGQAPASSKILALLGLIFGGVVTLLGLIVVAAVSSSGFYY